MIEVILSWNNIRFILSNIVEFYTVYLVLCIIFGKENIAPKRLLVLYLLLTAVLSISFISRLHYIINYTVETLGAMLGAIYCKGNKLKYIFVIIILNTIFLILEISVGLILSTILSASVDTVRHFNEIVDLNNLFSNCKELFTAFGLITCKSFQSSGSLKEIADVKLSDTNILYRPFLFKRLLNMLQTSNSFVTTFLFVNSFRQYGSLTPSFLTHPLTQKGLCVYNACILTPRSPCPPPLS